MFPLLRHSFFLLFFENKTLLYEIDVSTDGTLKSCKLRGQDAQCWRGDRFLVFFRWILSLKQRCVPFSWRAPRKGSSRSDYPAFLPLEPLMLIFFVILCRFPVQWKLRKDFSFVWYMTLFLEVYVYDLDWLRRRYEIFWQAVSTISDIFALA